MSDLAVSPPATGEPKVPVRPLLRILANGWTPAEGKGRRLKLTLIATPEYCPGLTAAEGAVEFSDWPAAVARMIRDKIAPFDGGSPTVFARIIAAAALPQVGEAGWTQLTDVKASARTAFAGEARWQRISALWKGALETGVANGWARLAQDIATSLDGAKRSADLQAAFSGNLNTDKDGAIVHNSGDGTQAVTVKGVLPIRQSDFAIEEEGVRAARVLTKQFKGAFAVDDETEKLEVLEERFPAATEATDPERAVTLFTHLRIKETLVPGSVSQADLDKAKADAEKAALPAPIVPPTPDVVHKAAGSGGVDPDKTGSIAAVRSGRDRRRATHRYGTWLQRSKPSAQDGKEPDEDTRAFQRMRGIYFSLQGDPILSRLFCLAFDFDIPEESLRKVVGSAASALVHLGTKPPEHGKARAAVATAAEFDTAHGFWPVSAFKAHIVETKDKDGNSSYNIANMPDFVEQEHGVWKLGVTTTVTGTDDSGGLKTMRVPRYDLASIDLRRSVDAKTRGRDRGESHQTGGFTILDRGRADQIARDLALAELQTKQVRDSNAVVVLHAEELTIGRRVDVAAAAAGADIGGLQWRSLMHRFVDFDFEAQDAVAEAVLGDLFHGSKKKKGLLEEVSFQVAARFMPTQADKADFEAIAEEAIFLWDGTPAGVLTDSGAEGERPSSQMPFSRKYDLAEDGRDGVDVPAAMRFGVPYAFKVRSMFLGGGSPEATDQKATDKTMLPAGAGAVARPTRFLRHERIAAPVLMLPSSLAQSKLGAMGTMGYEQLDQAIVRSWNGSGAPKAELLGDDAPINGVPIDGASRAAPDRTTRVIVPPEAAADLVARHGKFDAGDAIRTRVGGLTDVSYTPVQPQGGRPKPDQVKPSGFPVAVTARRDTLDPGGAIYRRQVAAAAVADSRGIPVFEPGANTTKRRDVGYLPDPAIDIYCVRARIRGSDRYLDDHIAVKVYEADQPYPNALPLVIVVEKRGMTASQARPAQAAKIRDIASDPVIAWLDKDGAIKAKKQSGRVRVQVIRVMLFPGEDFDLEVSCLPDRDTLAKYFSLPETIAIQLDCARSDPGSLSRLQEICGDGIAELCQAGELQQLTGLGGVQVPARATINEVSARLLGAMKLRWAIEEVAGVTSLRVCHAVNRPATAAVFNGAVTPFRNDAATCESALTPTLADKGDATGLLLDGKVDIDLEFTESFHIVAEIVAADSSLIDQASRGRSMISKRSGRWPILLQPNGSEAYVSALDVVGFKVGDDGAVELPRKTVTLLSVGNLPGHGAIGTLLQPKKDSKGVCVAEGKADKQLFTASSGRMMSVSLAPLFVAAAARAPIVHEIARHPDALDVLNRTRRLQIERPYAFKDTLARRLNLSLVSVSRFAAAYETAPTYSNGKEQALFRRQPLKRSDQTVASPAPVEVWLKSTRRPAAPDLRRPEPSFVIERGSMESEDGTELRYVVRRARTRLYLGRGWFSSGEGERLGIVLWPPHYKDLSSDDIDCDRIPFNERTLKLTDFDDADLGAGGAFVTRWGGDPVREDKSPQSGNLIPPKAFADIDRNGQGPHRPEFEADVMMPVPRASPPDGGTSGSGKNGASTAGDGEMQAYEYLRVSLLTFEPHFDLDREEWYVDIELKPIRASEPFVRFGLVRYQKQTISNELATSEPVTVTMQLLPERRAEIKETKPASPDGPSFKVSVKGLGSIDIKRLPPDELVGSDEQKRQWRNNFATLRRPKMKVALFHEAQGADGRLLRTPLRAPQLTEPASEEDWQNELPEPELENTTLVWSADFSLVRDELNELGTGRVVAYLEEVDRRMPATYRQEPILPSHMFDDRTFVDSGPRFSARIPFIELDGKL
ncbi:hypothetical protein [Mesorhizobium sp. YR577]|uniref:hypothetical protein n=1 Tax=Mesorhizobium sp. YR577 TaxID=1884373 RepID=UPI0008E7F744|nr:hypothetical protein [Mesorhizobium sp. YR577]SFU14119.1 hypothetical protein SAMN05518861_1155 [Mesorhizobium sp. YR577]